jgi:hypothetical protein
MRVSGVERESVSTIIQYREYLAGVNNFIDEASQAAWNVWTLAFYRSSLLGDDGAETQIANVSLVDSGSTVTLVCTTGGHRYTRVIPPIFGTQRF